MTNKITHKVISFPSVHLKENINYLNELILCWRHHAPPSPVPRHTSISTNINKVDCPICLGLWKDGIYA